MSIYYSQHWAHYISLMKTFEEFFIYKRMKEREDKTDLSFCFSNGELFSGIGGSCLSSIVRGVNTIIILFPFYNVRFKFDCFERV